MTRGRGDGTEYGCASPSHTLCAGVAVNGGRAKVGGYILVSGCICLYNIKGGPINFEFYNILLVCHVLA